MAPSGCNPLTLVVPFFSHFALMADVSTYSVKYLNVYEMDWLKYLARHFPRAVTVSRWCSPMTMPWPSLHATMRFTVLIFTCWLVCWLVCQRDYTKTTMNIHDLWVSAQNRTHLLLVQTWMNGEIQECLDLNEKDKVVFLWMQLWMVQSLEVHRAVDVWYQISLVWIGSWQRCALYWVLL